MSGFNFNITEDTVNFGAGLLTGWATAYAAYRARHIVRAARQAASQQASEAQQYAKRSADSRYIGDLIKYCQANHLAGESVSLSDILVEPRFIPAPELAAPPEEDVIHSVFHVVPIVPDHPYLHAPYNIETLRIEELDNGDRAIALLGLPGSGRTTALQAIALWSLGEVNFTTPTDPVEQRINEEMEELSHDERSQLINDRRQAEQMAKRRLAGKKDTIPSEAEEEEEEDDRPQISLFRQLTPVYVHMGEVVVNSREFGGRVDPAEPLIRAVQPYCGRVTSKSIPGKLYERLNEGKVLLLVDGYDDLPADEQPSRIDWLRALVDEYDHNFIIVAGPAQGYGGLLSAGLMPVFLRPWHDVDVSRAANIWAEVWPQFASTRRRSPPPPAEEVVAEAKQNNRALSPYELTLKYWATYANPEQTETEYEHRIQTLLAHYLPNEPLEELLPKLIMAAQLQLDEGYITVSRLEEIATGLVEPAPAEDGAPVQAATDETGEAENERSETNDEHFEDETESALDTLEDERLAMFDGDEIEEIEEDEELSLLEEAATAGPVEAEREAGAQPDAEDAQEEPEPETQIGKEYARLVNRLAKQGLLTYYQRYRRYQFRHPMLAAYFASLSLAEMSEDAVIERANSPAWQPALAYAAIHTDLDDIVYQRLDAPPDILQSQLLETSRWLAFADRSVEWRAAVLRHMGNMFVISNQYRRVRERVAAALIGTRDRNVLRIFERALHHPDPDVRRLSCLGVGALGADSLVDDIVTLLADEDPDVVLAAALALGAIGTEEALEEMIIALTSGTEQLRQAAAEAFAAIPDEGYPVLYDAVQHEDMMLRRAAVFGLRRISTSWALVALYRTMMEDDQWYVRSAAEGAFQEMQYGDRAAGVQAYPSIEEISWLREWIQSLGDGAVEEDQSPEDFLLRALEEGDPHTQTLSAINIGQLGLAHYIGILYLALRHQSEDVRQAAYQALSDLQLQMGRPIPSPV